MSVLLVKARGERLIVKSGKGYALKPSRTSAPAVCLVTARLVREARREAGAVPVPVISRPSAGPNQLLAAGTHLVRGAEDVSAVLRRS